MKRTLLIARREFAAYAKTVGFWLSLLAFPIFGVLGGAIPILMKTSEPIREVVVLEEGPQATGLAAAVQTALREEKDRREERRREAEAEAEKTGGKSGAAAVGGALSQLDGPKMTIVAPPADLAASAPGEAREQLVRRYLGEEVPEAQQLDSVVLLDRIEGKPSARVWTRRASDGAVGDFVERALKDTNRREVFQSVGIDVAVVESTNDNLRGTLRYA